jgi:predicted DsbA family dithiol-disulfide isomerase
MSGRTHRRERQFVMALDTSKAVQIDVVSDVMCPWCFIGKHNLEAAIDLVDDIDLDVHWRPYQLDPTLPKEGKDRKTYLSEKFGGDARAIEIYKRVEDAGRAAGIEFKFDKIEISPNTLDAHRLIRWAGGQGSDTQNRVVRRLFELYFLEGANIGDHDVLAYVAGGAGMDGALVRKLLESDKDIEAVQLEIANAQRMGISGVPCFIIDNRYAVMGAQPAESIAKAIRQAAANSPGE